MKHWTTKGKQMMIECPDYPPSDLITLEEQYPIETELMDKTVLTPQVRIQKALYHDLECVLHEIDDYNFFAETLKEIRATGLSEGDISMYALEAMNATGIDRRGEI